ncbi:MAG: hypothetical protein A3J35_03585 [Gammaproteobacteria bacterium RIFCSPLOWO2_02_FULL_52_10]|nr:MAG: hypothetical protein A3J35_03585 [Gammaproteobacteria bacterium RIFCSPLOWO2_02_FULL_52_10]
MKVNSTPSPLLFLVLNSLLFVTSVTIGADSEILKAERLIEEYNCSVCHGESGESPNNEWPNLAGQKAEYLVNSLEYYRVGRRANILMSPVAELLNGKEIELLANYYSQYVLPLPSKKSTESDDSAIELLASTFCAMCHGPQGISIRDDWPNLAAQKSEYLANQIRAYHSRERVDDVIMNASSHLLYENEITAVANYYSQLPGCSYVNESDSDKLCHLVSNGFNEKITYFGEGIYTYSYSTWSPIFVVTSEGAIVFDPINEEAAERVKEELASLGQKARYVILTHAHGDHVGGAKVFDEEAIIIAHDKTKAQIEARRKMELEVANRVGRTPNLEALPEVTFSTSLTLEVGDKVIELESLEDPTHSVGDLITVKINNPSLLILVDGVVPYGLAFMDFRATPIYTLLKNTRALEEMDFEYFSNGHSMVLPKETVTAFREYVEFIVTTVEKSIADGKTLQETQDSVVLPEEFDSWINKMPFPPMSEDEKHQALNVRLRFNVGGAYRQIKAYQNGEEVIDIHNMSL